MPFNKKILKFLSILLPATMPIASLMVTSCVDKQKEYSNKILHSWFHYRISKIQTDASENYFELNMPLVFSASTAEAYLLAKKYNAKLFFNFINYADFKRGPHVCTLIPWKLLNKLGYKKENEAKIDFDFMSRNIYWVEKENGVIRISNFALIIRDDDRSRIYTLKSEQKYFNFNKNNTTNCKLEVIYSKRAEGNLYEVPKTIATFNFVLKLNYENKQ
ncbi:Uncharacterised protein [Metamycoplasma arthritidis]|uniref:Hypothetical lipoprotein n=1 Tax=Metamycoplasma arthritidis (strain 158L3-1) TaxID=243272 RepID=B3PMX0_META1|nr:hypothetical protein [Metamycoplasma arthritidis]ACF07372.1 hypothetical lipoprotein [Metamycoplasma arthritidis 158L3-1]VEU78892.1 Uncharacterised protein [Metamycoplasma arthritidis]